jgi:hypothetical protein
MGLSLSGNLVLIGRPGMAGGHLPRWGRRLVSRLGGGPAARPSPLCEERVIKRAADREDAVQAGDAQQLRRLGPGGGKADGDA